MPGDREEGRLRFARGDVVLAAAGVGLTACILGGPGVCRRGNEAVLWAQGPDGRWYPLDLGDVDAEDLGSQGHPFTGHLDVCEARLWP